MVVERTSVVHEVPLTTSVTQSLAAYKEHSVGLVKNPSRLEEVVVLPPMLNTTVVGPKELKSFTAYYDMS